MLKPIVLDHISLTLPSKHCFDDFSTTLYPGDRIAIIGQNGCGKSSLLKMLDGTMMPSDGAIKKSADYSTGYVAQIIDDDPTLSGGQRFNAQLSRALAKDPDLLLLDEPTNHLDTNNRKSLMRLLAHYKGTLVVATHDTQLLQNHFDALWHIENGCIEVFLGSYEDYQREREIKSMQLKKQLSTLKQAQKARHKHLMQEQVRTAKSKKEGCKKMKQKKWSTIVGHSKMRQAQQTSGKKKAALAQERTRLVEKRASVEMHEILYPTFSLNSAQEKNGTVASIEGGSVGYCKEKTILTDLHLSILATEHIAIIGPNGTGKSTLIKAMMGDASVYKQGTWRLPKNIGYLDQHYNNLNGQKTILEQMRTTRPDWSEHQLRQHLSTFLFRSNASVSTLIKYLSGGEKARLSLSLIASKPPALLLLDEITNNLDLQTKEHVGEILKAYPGAMVMVCHDQAFLNDLNIDRYYPLKS